MTGAKRTIFSFSEATSLFCAAAAGFATRPLASQFDVRHRDGRGSILEIIN
jgi:hypothetical protein